jgi:hypothetical protein
MADTVKSGRQNAEPSGVIASQRPVHETCTAVDKVIEIASKRRRILSEMRTAVQVGDREAVFNLAKKLTGLSDETGHRTD